MVRTSAQSRHTTSQSTRRAVRTTRWQLVACVFALFVAACSDAPLAPNERMEAADVDHLMPSVVDAVSRLAPRIENEGVRERITYDLAQLQTAMTQADTRQVRFHTQVVADILSEYVAGPMAVDADAPDVQAIRLMLRAVSQVVHAGVQLNGGSA